MNTSCLPNGYAPSYSPTGRGRIHVLGFLPLPAGLGTEPVARRNIGDEGKGTEQARKQKQLSQNTHPIHRKSSVGIREEQKPFSPPSHWLLPQIAGILRGFCAFFAFFRVYGRLPAFVHAAEVSVLRWPRKNSRLFG